MSKGFVTIATGNERYYIMARNLLRSYRQNTDNPMPFAIIADRQNEYTKEFDEVIILENPRKNWEDKLSLLKIVPFEENIFIDADCIAYKDINFLWNLFENADDFSCFGAALPMDSKDGWFTSEASEIYPIHFITHLHGILYFIRKGETINKMHEVCCNIVQNYNHVKYKGFNDRIADEPIFALAMAILNLKPIERKAHYYCFVPFTTKFSSNYLNREVEFENPKDNNVNFCHLVHWGNQNTLTHQYKTDAYILNQLHKKPLNKIKCLEIIKKWFKFKDFIRAIFNKINWIFKILIKKFKKPN